MATATNRLQIRILHPKKRILKIKYGQVRLLIPVMNKNVELCAVEFERLIPFLYFQSVPESFWFPNLWEASSRNLGFLFSYGINSVSILDPQRLGNRTDSGTDCLSLLRVLLRFHPLLLDSGTDCRLYKYKKC